MVGTTWSIGTGSSTRTLVVAAAAALSRPK